MTATSGRAPGGVTIEINRVDSFEDWLREAGLLMTDEQFENDDPPKAYKVPGTSGENWIGVVRDGIGDWHFILWDAAFDNRIELGRVRFAYEVRVLCAALGVEV